MDPRVFEGQVRGSELTQVVELLKKNQRSDAKVKLADFMRRFPRDPRGPEIAGYIFLEEKNYDMADFSFHRALELNPSQSTARAKLGMSKLMQGKPKEAEAEFRKVLEQSPTDFVARRSMALLEEGRGNLYGAIVHYEHLIRSNTIPRNVLTEVHARLGKAYNLVGLHGETVALLEPLSGKAESPPVAVGANIVIGTAYVALGDKNNARKTTQALQKLLPQSNPELRILQAGVARLDRNFAAARQLLQQVNKDSPAFSATAQYEIARIHLAEGNWREGSKALQATAAIADKNDLPRILKDVLALHLENHSPRDIAPVLAMYANKYPDVPAIAVLVAQAYMDAGDEASAASTLKQVRTDHPDFAPGHYFSGLLAFAQNRQGDAEASFQRAVAIQPRYVDAWVAMSGQQLALGQHTKADTTLSSALKSNPGHPDLLFQQAALYDATNRTPEAIGIYRSILAKYPTHVPSLNKLARNLADSGSDLSEAKRYAEQAYRLAPYDATIQGTYGWVMVRAGNAKAGVPLLESAIKEMAKDGSTNFHLGTAYLKTGKTEEGKRLLARAVELGVSAPVKREIDDLLK